MERQSVGDLEDLVDGMDLSEKWGEENLKSEDLGEEYAQWVVTKKNARIRAAMPQDVKDDPINVMLGTEVYELPEELTEFMDVFTHLMQTKLRRVGLEAPRGLYVAKYRAKDSLDPRTQIRFHV